MINSYNVYSRVLIINCLKNYIFIKVYYLFEVKVLLIKFVGWFINYKGEDVFFFELIKDCFNVKNDLLVVVLNVLNLIL